MVFKQPISFHRIFHTITLALNSVSQKMLLVIAWTICIIFAMENSRTNVWHLYQSRLYKISPSNTWAHVGMNKIISDYVPWFETRKTDMQLCDFYFIFILQLYGDWDYKQDNSCLLIIMTCVNRIQDHSDKLWPTLVTCTSMPVRAFPSCSQQG